MNVLITLIIIFYLAPFIVRKVLQARSGVARDNVIRMTKNPFANFIKNVIQHNSLNVTRMKTSLSGKVGWFIVIVCIVIVLFNAIVIIPAGHTGVVDFFGTVRDREINSGIHLINPFARVIPMSVRTDEYTMSIAHGEGRRKGADAIRALTAEGLAVDLDITVFYHLTEDKAADVYRNLGLNYAEKIIRPEIRSAIRAVIAHYDAKAVYSDKREEIAQAIADRLRATIMPRGIAVEQVLLRNVTLPTNLANSIQQKLQAEQESQRYDFLLEKEKKEAARKRIEAEGQRDAQQIINQSLTPAYLQYLYIKELKDRKGTIYVPTGANGIPLYRGI